MQDDFDSQEEEIRSEGDTNWMPFVYVLFSYIIFTDMKLGTECYHFKASKEFKDGYIF